jgi:2-dehydropantoate 2-reductase
MKITVFGTGGIGGYYGGRLAASGCDVGFVARGGQLNALRSSGLRVESALGPVELPRVRAAEDPAELGTPDVVFVCVKLWDLDHAVEELRPVVGPATVLVSFGNGVQKDDVLRAAFGERAVMGGVAYIGARVERPGVIRHTGTQNKLIFGEYGGERSQRALALLDVCVRAGIDASISDDIRRTIWEKFVFLVGMSGATAAMRSSVGPIRTHPRSRQFLRDLMSEVVAVGRAHGVALDDSWVDDRLAFSDSLPAEMESSMYVDLQHGRRLELPWLSGAVVDLGAAKGVPTPMNRAVNDILSIHSGGAQGT